MLKVDYLDGATVNIDNDEDSTSFIIQLPDLSIYTFGEMIAWSNNNVSNSIKCPTKLQAFNIQLLNSDNIALDLNSLEWSFTLKFE